MMNLLKKQSSIGVGLLGLTLLLSALFIAYDNKVLWLSVSFVLMTLGGLIYFQTIYGHQLSGIKNNGVWFSALTTRGITGWLLGMGLTAFYIAIYWFPEVLGFNTQGESTGLVAFFDTLSLKNIYLKH